MKIFTRNKFAWILAVAAIFLLTAAVQAGMGYGPRGQGYGGGYDCPFANRGYGGGSLTDEQLRQIDTQRQAFYNETKDIRDNLYVKELELEAELAKANPALDKVKSIQKEISQLQAQLDEKWAEHVVEMKKINPNSGRGYARGDCPRGYGGGQGRGFHHRYDRQGWGGNCWN